MLTEADKLNGWRKFQNSDEFGTDTSNVIYMLGVNVRNIIDTIELYRVLLRKLDEGVFNDVLTNTVTPAGMIQIKQHIVLDMILKTEIIIESFLVFVNHLSDKYKGLAEAMTYYDQKLVRAIMDKVGKKKFNIRRALALPNISDLPIDSDERKLLADVYRKSENAAWDALGKMVEFYDKFRIVYGKSKHGLTFATNVAIDTGGEGTQTSSTSSQFETSALIAYDRKRIQDMPKDFMEDMPEDLSVQDWFNAHAHLNFGQKLFDEISTVTDAMTILVPYVCRSHITYALNCGEGYLPYRRIDEKTVQLDFLVSPSDEEELRRKQSTFDSISKKIFPNMNTNEQEFKLNTSYKNNLVELIKNNTVTNMRYKGNGKTNNNVELMDPSSFALSRFVRCISSSPI